jgi:hypothetical protein
LLLDDLLGALLKVSSWMLFFISGAHISSLIRFNLLILPCSSKASAVSN